MKIPLFEVKCSGTCGFTAWLSGQTYTSRTERMEGISYQVVFMAHPEASEPVDLTCPCPIQCAAPFAGVPSPLVMTGRFGTLDTPSAGDQPAPASSTIAVGPERGCSGAQSQGAPSQELPVVEKAIRVTIGKVPTGPHIDDKGRLCITEAYSGACTVEIGTMTPKERDRLHELDPDCPFPTTAELAADLKDIGLLKAITIDAEHRYPHPPLTDEEQAELSLDEAEAELDKFCEEAWQAEPETIPPKGFKTVAEYKADIERSKLKKGELLNGVLRKYGVPTLPPDLANQATQVIEGIGYHLLVKELEKQEATKASNDDKCEDPGLQPCAECGAGFKPRGPWDRWCETCDIPFGTH